jgi:hypothetical protein
MANRNAGRRLDVIDSEALATVARWLLDVQGPTWAEYDKRQQRRATGARVPGRTLRRLMAREAEHVSDDTYSALELQVIVHGDEHLRATLAAAVETEAERWILDGWHDWEDERIGRFFFRRGVRYAWQPSPTGRGGRVERIEDGPAADGMADAATAYALRRAPTQLALARLNAFRELWGRLLAIRDAKKLIYQFTKDLARAEYYAPFGDPEEEGYFPPIPVLRVVEPLLESEESAFVERGWREFDDGELVQFLRYGFSSERLLMRREGNRQRAHGFTTRREPPAAEKSARKRGRREASR